MDNTTKEIYQKALEADKQGDWDAAHDLVQDINSPEAAWIHAYLHRKEGDDGNAGYWYGRAGRSFCHHTLDEEWQSLWDYFSQA